MKRNYKIYMHKNKINGKVYIGQTYTSLRTRFGKNGIKYKGCPIFYNAIQKYGWDNFEHEILEENIPNAEISNEREKYYIELYNSTDRNFGYNIQIGGNEQTKLSIKVYQYSLKGDYIKEYNSIADAMRDCNISNGKISECCSGKRKSIGGYRWSYKKSDNYFNIESPQEDLPQVKIAQYDKEGNLIKIWNSPKECKKEFKYCLRVCQGSLKSTQNYIFKYID